MALGSEHEGSSSLGPHDVVLVLAKEVSRGVIVGHHNELPTLRPGLGDAKVPGVIPDNLGEVACNKCKYRKTSKFKYIKTLIAWGA